VAGQTSTSLIQGLSRLVWALLEKTADLRTQVLLSPPLTCSTQADVSVVGAPHPEVAINREGMLAMG
jgi:hypothetical protein